MRMLTFIAWIGAMVLMLSACGQQPPPTVETEFDLTVRTEQERLTVGETTLIINLKDASGSPIDGATLQVHGDMDHAGMTPVDREVSISTNGEYRVPFEWTMGGGWIVSVTVQLPNNGGEITEAFDFFVEAVSSESIINHNATTATPVERTTGGDAEDIHIRYQPDNNPAHSGDATVTVTLTDQVGNAITDAAVEVTGDMAHAGMMPITGEGEHTGSGQYVVPVRWTMAGDWIVTINVTLADGRQSKAVFDQEVVVP